MALDKFKKSAINGGNSINLDQWHQPTGGFTATDAKINLQSLKGVRREQFELMDDATLERKKKAKDEFKHLSKNGRASLKIDEEVAKEIVANNAQLINTGKAISDAEVSNQKLAGDFSKRLQQNRVKLARVKANGQQAIEQANNQVEAIFSASKSSVKEAIFL